MITLLLLAMTLLLAVGLTSTVDLSVLFNETIAIHQNVCFLGQESCSASTSIGIPLAPNSTAATGPAIGKADCCGSCSCADDCFAYGTCCLHKYIDFTEAKHYSENPRYKCVTPEYIVRKSRDYRSPYSQWMTTQCEHENFPKDIKEKCSKPFFESFESLTPVTDMSSNEIYRNIFCAQCNSAPKAEHLKPWDINIVCDGVLQLPDKNMLASMNEQNCSIIFENIQHFGIRFCQKPLFSSCNETGLWREYDSLTDLACHSFEDLFNLTYKNYFCYLCNAEDPMTSTDNLICVKDIQRSDFMPSFTTIIDLDVFRRWENDEILHCDKERQFEDYKLMKCREVHCFESRHLSRDDCRYDKSKTDNFCYAVFIKVTPVEGIRLEYDYLKDETLINDLNTRTARGWSFSINDVVELIGIFVDEESLEVKLNIEFVKYFFLHLLINTAFIKERDVVETFYDALGPALTIEVPRPFREDLRLLLTLSAYSLNVRELHNLFEDRNYVLLNGLRAVHIKELGAPTCLQKQLVALTKIKICPFIKITFDELSMEVQNKTLIVNVTETKFSKLDYEKHGGEIYMCLKDYTVIYKELPLIQFIRTSTHRIIIDVKDILSFSCVCLSLVCLVITIATYLYFRELQTQPGINTVTMCIYLLLAQGVYQFGVGQSSLPSWACSLIGAISHFLWLSVMFSMNVCSIQIYLTFLRNHQISPKYKWRQTVINLTYVVLASLFFVGINVAVSLSRSDGHEIGYGGTICYLSSTLMHGITFLMPSVMVLSSNIILFISVALRLTKISKETAKLNNDKSYLLVYARLSALFGFTWILALFQILFHAEVFEYLFIIFNASQGVFIMAAFILNRRVRLLFCPTVRRKQSKPFAFNTTK